jgi:hypothetical protein
LNVIIPEPLLPELLLEDPELELALLPDELLPVFPDEDPVVPLDDPPPDEPPPDPEELFKVPLPPLDEQFPKTKSDATQPATPKTVCLVVILFPAVWEKNAINAPRNDPPSPPKSARSACRADKTLSTADDVVALPASPVAGTRPDGSRNG